MQKFLLIALLISVPTMARAQDPEAGEVAGEGPVAEAEPSEPAPEPMAVDVNETASTASDETSSDAAPEYDTRYPNKKYIDAVHERSKHMSLGYALGRHGEGFIFGPRFDLPVTKKHWGYLQFFQYTNFGNFRRPFDPVLMLGVNFITHTKVIMGIFRLYGGGGFFVGWRPSPACKNPVDQSDLAQAYVNEGYAPFATTDPVATARVNARVDALRDKCEEQKDPFTISGGGTGGIEFFASPMRAYFIELSGGGGAQKNGIWNDTGLVLRAGNQFYF